MADKNRVLAAPETRLTSRQEKADIVRQRVIQSALQAFAIHGYEGARLKDIAAAADISLPLLVYHFESKENLWETAMRQAAGLLDERIRELNAASDLSPTDKLRQLVIALVGVCAEFPEFHRIMSMESYKLSERLIFLCKQCAKHHYLSMMEIITNAQKYSPQMSQISAERLCYVMISMARISNNAAEFEYLTGIDPKNPREIKTTIEDICNLLRIPA